MGLVSCFISRIGQHSHPKFVGVLGTIRTSRRLWWFSCSSAAILHTGVAAGMSTTTTSTGTGTSSTSATPRAAIAQLRSSSNKLSNLFHVAQCAGWAQRKGASMLFLPECFGFMGESSVQTLQQAEPPIEIVSSMGNNIKDDGNDLARDITITRKKNDPKVNDLLKTTVQKSATEEESTTENNNIDIDAAATTEYGTISLLDGLQTIARASNLWISAGGMHVSGAPTHQESSSSSSSSDSSRSRVYNSHVILDNTGTVQCVYNKIHLFDVSIPNKVNLKESNTTAPGTDVVVCDSPIGKLGVSTCYDIRFPEMYIQLVQKKGAQILLVPSAFTVPTGKAHWHLLLRARAIENQCYVLAAAQYGEHNAKRKSYGHSLAVDPWGGILADGGGYDSDNHHSVATPSIITCDIDLENLQSIRQRMPIQQHRDAAGSSAFF